VTVIDPYNIYIKLNPDDINLLNKIIEGYDNLAVVTALNPTEGRMVVRVTPDTRRDVLKLLKHLPFFVEILEEEKG
jgi:hypothetical protein